MIPTEPNLRDKIIALCDKAIVHHSKWSDRDTPEAQISVATIRAYLMAGCPFRIKTRKKNAHDDTVTNERTIWIEIKHYIFEDELGWGVYYMPTEKRIEEANGNDWY